MVIKSSKPKYVKKLKELLKKYGKICYDLLLMRLNYNSKKHDKETKKERRNFLLRISNQVSKQLVKDNLRFLTCASLESQLDLEKPA